MNQFTKILRRLLPGLIAGLGNYPHFSVLFKKHFNVTPKHYKGSEK